MGRAVVKYFTDMYNIEEQVGPINNNADNRRNYGNLDVQPAFQENLEMFMQAADLVEAGISVQVELKRMQKDPLEPVSGIHQMKINYHLLDTHDPLLDDHDDLSDVGDLSDNENLLDEEHNV